MSNIAKSANEVQTSSAGLAKTSVAYWAKKVRVPAGRSHYGIQIAYKGRRQFFNLETAEKAAAAANARRLYLDIIGKGWEGALAVHRPEIVKAKKSATVGALIEAAAKHSTARPVSFETYAKALRRLALGIADPKGKGGKDARRELADSIRLDKLTPAAVSAFKVRFLKEAKTEAERDARAVTINSLIRNSAALLKKRGRVRQFVGEEIELPAELWFEGIEKEEEPSLRYESKIDAGTILADAQTELRAEPLKALLLTLCLGLRRSEADALLWEQFDFQAGTLDIRSTAAKTLKSKSSKGTLVLDDELKALFLGFHAASKGAFVMEMPRSARVDARKGREYRCRPAFDELAKWLSKKGVPGNRPIHTMRKEVGSVIATEQGIFAASRFLRHSTIQITSKIYADLKTPVSAGLGKFLKPSAPNVIEAEFKAPQGAEKRKGGAAQ